MKKRIAKEKKEEEERQDNLRKTQSEPAIESTATPVLRGTKSETDIEKLTNIDFLWIWVEKYIIKNKNAKVLNIKKDHEKYNKLPHDEFYVADVFLKFNIIKKTTTQPRPYIELSVQSENKDGDIQF